MIYRKEEAQKSTLKRLLYITMSMQFLAEDVVAARNPTSEELKAWYMKNTDDWFLQRSVYID